MKRRTPFAGLLALLCLIALLGVQVCGGVRGYVSDSSGAVEWMVQDPCSDEDGAGGTTDHEQVRDDVQVRLRPALEAPAHVPVLAAVLEDDAFGALPSFLPSHIAARDRNVGPPPGVMVARTVVLLI